MKIISNKQNVRFIRINKDALTYIGTDNAVYHNNEVVYESDENLQELYAFESFLYTNTSKNGDGILMQLLTKTNQFFKGKYINKIFEKFILLEEGNQTRITEIDKIESHDGIIFQFRIFIYLIKLSKDILINSDHDFFINKSIINLYKLSTGNKIWSFDLKVLGTWGKESKPYMIGEFSGIHENTLICTLQNGNILLLDLITGELKHIFENAKIISGLIQKENSVFWGAKYTEFVEVDVDKQITLRQISLESEFNRMLTVTNGEPGWFAIAKSFFYDGLFYFNSDSIIGILDPIEIKIIDFMKLELTESSVIKDVQVNGYLIYCLETKGNLTILESEAAKEYKKKHQKKL